MEENIRIDVSNILPASLTDIQYLIDCGLDIRFNQVFGKNTYIVEDMHEIYAKLDYLKFLRLSKRFTVIIRNEHVILLN